jgi:hypothetical protein
VPLLRQARAVDALKEAMASAEDAPQGADAGLSQTHTLRLAGMMAIARLVDATDLPSLRISRETLKDGVEALRHALQGRAWSPLILDAPCALVLLHPWTACRLLLEST